MAAKQRIYPDEQQLAVFAAHCGHARFVWNLGLEQRSFWRRDHKGRRPVINVASQMRELAQARQAFDWLRQGSSSVQQAALRDLDRAFQNWLKNPGHYRYPTWRKRSDKQSFVVRDINVKRASAKTALVFVPKAGWVRFRLSVPFEQVAAASSARVTRDAGGRWHVSFVTPVRQFDRPHRTGQIVGIDRGVANTLALDSGRMCHAPTLSTSEQVRYVALQRRLSRQVKGSRRRERTRLAIGRLSVRLTDRRKDWIEKTTTALVREYDVIAVEDLRVKNMVRKPKAKPDPDQPGVFLPNVARAKAALNRAIHSSAWSMFLQRLQDKVDACPDDTRPALVRVDPKNTSRQCAACKKVDAGNRESQAVFQCVHCGHQAHADTNAAVNILARGLALIEPQGMRGSDASVSPEVSRVNQLDAA